MVSVFHCFRLLVVSFLIETANLATKKRIQKRGQVTPFMQVSRSRMSDVSQSGAVQVGIEERNRSLATGNDKSYSRVKDDVLETDLDKENHISSPLPITATSSSNPSRRDGHDVPISSELGKSLSERVKHYLSSKMNQILPDSVVTSELRELEILQAGGQFNDNNDSKLDN